MSAKLSPEALFDLDGFEHARIFDGCTYVWQALTRISKYIADHVGESGRLIFGDVSPDAYLGEGLIVIGPGTIVDPGAYIIGPTVIGAHCLIKHGCFIRGNAIIGDRAVVGHATQVKNSILLPDAGAPHFNYVGDSILGRNTNLGAGTKLSNLSMLSVKDPSTAKRPSIHIEVDGKTIDTDLAKFGAVLGDGAQTGCNSVLNPGVILGRNTLVYANASLAKGYYPADSIIKLRQMTEISARR